MKRPNIPESVPPPRRLNPRSGPGALNTILSSAAITTFAVLGAMILGGVRQIAAARALGPTDYGAIGLAESIENVLIRVAPLGLLISIPLMLARARAMNDDRAASQVLSTGLVLGVGLATLAGTAVTLSSGRITALLNVPAAELTLGIWGIVVVALTVVNVSAACLQGMLRIPAATFTREILPSALLLFSVGGAIAFGIGGTEIAWSYAAGASAAAVIGIVMLTRSMRRYGLRFDVSGEQLRPLLALSLPMITMVVAGQLVRQVNTPFLAGARELADVGVFSATFFLGTTVEAVFLALTFVYVPFASTMLAENRQDHLADVQAAVGRWTYLFTLAPATVLFMNAEGVLALLFGQGYVAGAQSLRILILGLLVQAVMGPRNPVLLALGSGRSVMMSFIASLGVAVVITATLVPTTGMVGAATSIAAALSVRAVIAYAQLRRRLPRTRMRSRDRYISLTIIPFVAGAFLPQPAPVIGAIAGAMLGLAVLRVTLDESDREFLNLLKSGFARVRGRSI